MHLIERCGRHTGANSLQQSAWKSHQEITIPFVRVNKMNKGNGAIEIFNFENFTWDLNKALFRLLVWVLCEGNHIVWCLSCMQHGETQHKALLPRSGFPLNIFKSVRWNEEQKFSLTKILRNIQVLFFVIFFIYTQVWKHRVHKRHNCP